MIEDLMQATDADLAREAIVRGRLHEFVRQFWHVYEPGVPFVDNWHIGAVCEFYQAIYDLEIRRGVINVPPGTGKSMTCGVFGPAWVFGENPAFKHLCAGFDPSLVLRDAGRMRDIMVSDLYREIYPETVLLADKQAVSEMWTSKRGLRLSTSIKGKGLGWHGNMFMVDDSVKASEAIQEKSIANQRVIEWYQTTAQSRKADPKTFRFLCIMQRVAENDLPGHLLDLGFEHLCLPMRYAPKATWIRGGWSEKLDKRQEPGELLFPERFPEEEVSRQEVELGTEQNVSAQMQQNPIPGKGGLVDIDWFRHWTHLPNSLIFFQVWDFGAKGTKSTHSRTVGDLFAYDPSAKDLYLVDEVRGVWTLPDQQDQYVDVFKRPHWGKAYCAVFEAKANGVGIAQNVERGKIKNTIGGEVLTPKLLEPSEGDKYLRIFKHVPHIREGHLYLPPEKAFPNLRGKDGWIPEITGFPRATYNDRVDVLSMALDFILNESLAMIAWARYGKQNDANNDPDFDD